MKLLTINILHHRRNFLELILLTLANIKDNLKQIVKINILSNTNLVVPNINTGIETNIYRFPPGHNYMEKVYLAQETDTYLSCKTDEDYIGSHHIWNYLLETCEDVLSDKSNIIYTTCLATGVPSADYWLREYFDDERRKVIEDIFLETRITENANCILPAYDAELSRKFMGLNELTIGATEWDGGKWWKKVREANHLYSGIHPVRVNLKAQRQIMDYIVSDLSRGDTRIWDNKSFKNISLKPPYFCNSFFIVRTEDWKYYSKESKYRYDCFEESSLNSYRKDNDLNMVFANGFGSHLMYSNCCEYPTDLNPYSSKEGHVLEQWFYDRLLTSYQEYIK